MFLLLLCPYLISVSFATITPDPDCNYYQQMQFGQTYYVYNNEIPALYGPGKQCLWIAVAPAGYKVYIKCAIEIPQSPSCSEDRLLISPTGSSNLDDAYIYCGNGSITLTSAFNNRMSVGLITSYNTQGGKFSCEMIAVQSSVCECGWKNTRRIVGGVLTQVNEYPMMAGLVNFVQKDIFCGATIIAQKYAITAAHCSKLVTTDKMGLIVGAHKITSNNQKVTKLYLVEQLIIHPSFNDRNGQNDIAIVKTSESIEFNMKVGPACLPIRYGTNSFAGEIVEALGWGTTEFTGPKSDSLLKTTLKILSYQDCYRNASGIVDQICTFESGHDSCQGDSGGPLLWQDTNTNRIYLVGVISSGKGCGGTSVGLNTRVTSFLNWISTVTQGTEYCQI